MSSSRPAGSGEQKKPAVDLIRRGIKKSNPLGTLTFVGLRLLDPVLQYNLLAGGWGNQVLSKLGVSAALSATPVATVLVGIPYIDSLDLPLSHLIILGLSVGSAVKQIYWLVSLSSEEFTPSVAVAVSFYNTFMNSANTLLFLSASTSVLSGTTTDFPGTNLPYQLVVGAALYIIGMSIETISEYQRKVFKDKPENKGKVFKSGLWSWARHINYGGYSLWRAAYCFSSSGWAGGLAMGLWQSCDFVFRAIPVIDEYCAGRYGQQWTQFKMEVPYVILPGIY